MSAVGHTTRFTPAAQRDLRKVPLAEARKILRRLTDLQRALDAGDTAHLDIKALRTAEGCFWLRIGDYRAIYTVEDGTLVIWVLAVRDRRDVHRDR